MADENNQDILEQLKLSFSADKNNGTNGLEDQSDASDIFSGDELQAQLRSKFLNNGAKSTDAQDD